MTNGKTSRIWCFTYFWEGQTKMLWTGRDDRAAIALSLLSLQKNNDVKACCFQEEICPNTGKKHIQGVVRFKESYRLKGAQTHLFGEQSTIHMEICRDEQASVLYCSKTDTRIDDSEWQCNWGFPKRQGERNDLKRAIGTLFEDDGGMVALAEQHASVYVRYHRGLHALYNIRRKPIAAKREVRVHWGAPGLGKTYDVYHKEGATVFDVAHPGADNKLWFDGYIDQNTILFDDFYGWIKYTWWLKMCDENPIMLPIKGGFVPCIATTIMFTSNQHPRHWYVCDEKRIFKKAIQRRIDKIIHYKSKHFRAEQYWLESDTIDLIDNGGPEILLNKSQEMPTLLGVHSTSENYNK